ncbi:MAG: hypothetical protein J5449_08440, partial [Oscillospiraceae bacterium]|nr:hypothetical protein [Oscillospiraceae bacterium]
MKKLLSTLLALTMLFVYAVPAFAADDEGGDVRDTNFFTEQEHTDLNFSDLKYEKVELQPILDEAAALKELAKDPANAKEFEERFFAFKDSVYYLYGMWCIVDIQTDHDANDEWAVEESQAAYADLLDAFDAFNGVVRDVLLLENACSEVLSSRLTEEDIADYLDYEDMTDEERDLNAREQELVAAYKSLDTKAGDMEFEYEGVKYTDNNVYDAYTAGDIDYDTYVTISRYIAKELNLKYGEIFMELLEIRNKLAVLKGYENYAEYAYPETYNRDYTTKDIEAFAAAVKEYLCDDFWTLVDFMSSPDATEFPLEPEAYTGSNVFETLMPYFGQLSDELLESATYIYEHGSYDLDPYPGKTGTAYSRCIAYYNMPFFFNNADGNYNDLTTAIHELGHNNNTYWSGHDWNDPSTDIDTAEVHSQGLELLMFKFYPEMFGTQADAVAQKTLVNIIYSVIQGCIHDELQRFAYATPNVTLQQINEFYCKIMKEYGRIAKDDPRTEMYGWYEVP